MFLKKTFFLTMISLNLLFSQDSEGLLQIQNDHPSPLSESPKQPEDYNIQTQNDTRSLGPDFSKTSSSPTLSKPFEAYTIPAALSLKEGWDVNVFGSWIYWYVTEEQLSLGFIPAEPNTNPLFQVNGSVIFPKFTYQDGFKIGLGLNTNTDGWTLKAEYTQLHQRISQVDNAPKSSVEDILFISKWYIIDPDDLIQDVFPSTMASTWKMYFDQIDLTLGRPFYEGQKLIVSPYLGLRTLWIRQKVTVLGTQTNDNDYFLTEASSHCWSLGPVVGTSGWWLLGLGLRLEGKIGTSLLYTQYQADYDQNAPTQISGNPNQQLPTSSHTSFSVLRPTADLGLGLGWGHFLFHDRLHLDLSARYDFNILWDQNILSQMVADLSDEIGSNGNLYLHGLTFSGRLDF